MIWPRTVMVTAPVAQTLCTEFAGRTNLTHWCGYPPRAVILDMHGVALDEGETYLIVIVPRHMPPGGVPYPGNDTVPPGTVKPEDYPAADFSRIRYLWGRGTCWRVEEAIGQL